MANILPVSDLRNYNEVLKNCHKKTSLKRLVLLGLFGRHERI